MMICVLGLVLWPAERGEWDEQHRIFVRSSSWRSQFICTCRAQFGMFAGCFAPGDVVCMVRVSAGECFSAQHLHFQMFWLTKSRNCAGSSMCPYTQPDSGPSSKIARAGCKKKVYSAP